MTLMTLLLLAGALAAQDTVPGPVRSVDSLDLERYAGVWHEVARYPNRFQAKCVGETTATYEVLEDGQVRVVNTCRTADGGMSRAEGRARRADREGPASRLKVRFAPAFLSWLPMVWGDYWVLDLTEDYGAALVGTPDRNFLWVLSRTPAMPDSTWVRMTATAAAQGFDVSRLARAPGAAPAPLPPDSSQRPPPPR
ncbi:MAG TPA: lipocalin family protein [Gemmatimonadales bacterium]|nr:lipocalin family protein [Gemmatimonadales bacterium]